MSVPFALGYFLWIYHNLANRRSTAASDGISQYVSNKVVLSGIIASKDGRRGQGDVSSNLDPGTILSGANDRGCLTHLRTTFVSVCLKKIIVIFSVLDVSRKVITLETSKPGGNVDSSCGKHD